jgi:glycogen debranching enzyme
MSRRGTFSLQMETSVVNESRTQETDKVKTLTTRNRPSSIVWESTEHKLGDARAILETDHPTLGDAYLQANTDLISLRTKSEETHQNEYTIVAGIPWYMALFGRDSLIVSYQTMLHDPALARGTLHTLAKLQGADVDPISLEEPGKILHEYRRGEILSRRKLIPKFPYYGSIDATPLFLITLSEYVRCTGDLEFARALWPHVLNALQWIDQFGDADGDGFCEYFLKAESGPSNQGWKDSYDSIRFQDGRIARGSIALIEVQGYIVDAWTRMAELSSHLGNSQLARALIVRATKLKEKIVSAYWLKKRNYFALALDGEKTPVDSLTSNPGHLLWSGVLSQNHAKKLADKLLSDELFSGFGVRTMGTEEKGYNPLSYHNGSVWPHDNSLIVEGLVRYGFSGEATRITEGLLGALSHYSDPRLPELFSGYSSARFGIPIEYPSASRPQAWASGAIISLVRSLLGLRCNALTKQITLTPTPLPGMSFLKLKGVPLAGHFVDIEVSFRKNAGPKTVITGLAMSEWNTKTATQ